jgi:hypothetical protein
VIAVRVASPGQNERVRRVVKEKALQPSAHVTKSGAAGRGDVLVGQAQEMRDAGRQAEVAQRPERLTLTHRAQALRRKGARVTM